MSHTRKVLFLSVMLWCTLFLQYGCMINIDLSERPHQFITNENVQFHTLGGVGRGGVGQGKVGTMGEYDFN
jgi:hypothetical protein